MYIRPCGYPAARFLECPDHSAAAQIAEIARSSNSHRNPGACIAGAPVHALTGACDLAGDMGKTTPDGFSHHVAQSFISTMRFASMSPRA